MEIADGGIDELDEQIVRLINQRAGRRAIGGPNRISLPVYEPQREKDVFDHSTQIPGHSRRSRLSMYERIIDVMQALQKHHDRMESARNQV
jgi:chorismate mutase